MISRDEVVAECVRKLPELIQTENRDLNRLARTLYEQCLFNRLNDPQPATPDKPSAMPYKWFAPGGGYQGQWIFDTPFVTLMYAALDDDATIREAYENFWYTIDNNPEAPKGSYRYGMIPNYLRWWPPLGYSQMPILGWGCDLLERMTADTTLIERALPYLVDFDTWYANERDLDQDGLVEYGTYKPFVPSMVQTARFETMDYTPSLDDMKMTRHPRHDSEEWYGNVDGVDNTCYLIMTERGIANMAQRLGQDELAQRFDKIVARRVQAVREKMWDPKTRFFHSIDRDSHALIPARTIQGFFTLESGVATPQQAAALVEQLTDPRQWWCKYPVPTVAMDDPKFDPKGCWRGDVWTPTTYMVTRGLNRYGYHDVARELTMRSVELVANNGVNERYHGGTGQPLGVPELGMTGAVWLMVVENLYGLQGAFDTIRIPPNAKGRRLKYGKFEISYPEDTTVEMRVGFDRQMTVAFPEAQDLTRAEVLCDGASVTEGNVTVDGNALKFSAKAGKLYQIASH